MRKFAAIENARFNRPGFTYKPINQTCAKHLFNSDEEFLELASKAGMVEGEDYYMYKDGTIHSYDRATEKLIDLKTDEWRKESDDAKKELLYWVYEPCGYFTTDAIMYRILDGDYTGIKTFRQYRKDYDAWPDANAIARMKDAGLVRDMDFVLLIEDPGDLTDALITEEGWSRFIARYPEYDCTKESA